MSFICLFLPASISILISEKLKKEKRSVRDLILSYFGYTFVIATIMNTLVYLVTETKNAWYQLSTFTLGFSLQYTWLSLLIAVVLPCLFYIVSKVVQINIEVKERKKDVTQRNKSRKKSR